MGTKVPLYSVGKSTVNPHLYLEVRTRTFSKPKRRNKKNSSDRDQKDIRADNRVDQAEDREDNPRKDIRADPQVNRHLLPEEQHVASIIKVKKKHQNLSRILSTKA